MSKVTIVVSGETGSGKSAIAGEIEIALKAIGVPVVWPNADRESWTHGNEYWIDLYKPEVTIIEQNIPVKTCWQCADCSGAVAQSGKPNFCPYCRGSNLADVGR